MERGPANQPVQGSKVRTDKVRVVLVTGLSGAGKSSALRAFEDLGFEAIDNLPLALLPALLSLDDDNPDHQPTNAIAVGIDSRTRAFRADRFEADLAALRNRDHINLTLLFLECSDDVLARRFTETRRRHPLAVDRPVRDGIARERQTMEVVRGHADYIFDTTDLTGHELKRSITQGFTQTTGAGGSRLMVTVASFAYPRGLPRDADLVFDVRFLRNPHYDPELRPMSGRNAGVAAYVEADPSYAPFVERLQEMLISLLPLYEREGKAYLTIAFGCTGGRHRSVLLTERMGQMLIEQGYRVNVIHRELERAREISDTVLGDVL
ncbi:RNase adapter RapZ [Govanella unica]|uniref:RNase adapter RapZ n=1 Tax=Govanella unica TaxID=2975056 RepID=A0A9X3Z7T0_9PROT|nr:RNase adapter RapZ [Govania unica]MDA5194565.1 RNase adapter RapZ [Govania unica]